MYVGDGRWVVEKRLAVKPMAEVWRETQSPRNHSKNNRLHRNEGGVTNPKMCTVARVVLEPAGKSHPDLTRSPLRFALDRLPGLRLWFHYGDTALAGNSPDSSRNEHGSRKHAWKNNNATVLDRKPADPIHGDTRSLPRCKKPSMPPKR